MRFDFHDAIRAFLWTQLKQKVFNRSLQIPLQSKLPPKLHCCFWYEHFLPLNMEKNIKKQLFFSKNNNNVFLFH